MSSAPRWLGPRALVVSYVLAVVLLGLWLGTAEIPALKHQLASLTPWSLELALLLLLGGGWAARKAIGRSLVGNHVTALLLALLGFISVALLPPRTNRIFYDEAIYQNVGQSILWRGKAEMCNEGILEHGAFE